MVSYTIRRNALAVRRQPRRDFSQRLFGPGFNRFFGLVLNRVLHVDGVEVRPSERARLGPRRQHEFVCGDRDGRNP